MSQTVKIDAAAQDAIAEIVGMPWEKDYFDNTHDKDSAYIATVTREGTSVRIYVCDESLCSADLWSFEAERERQKFCVHGIIGARQTGASNEHEHQTQFS